MNLAEIQLTDLISVLAVAAGVLFTFIKGERDRKAARDQFDRQLEVEKDRLREEAREHFADEAQNVLGLYRDSFEECGRRIDALEAENQKKDERIADLEARLDAEIASKRAVLRENEELKVRVASLEEQVNQLREAQGQ